MSTGMSLTHIYAHIPGNPWEDLSSPDGPTFCDPGARSPYTQRRSALNYIIVYPMKAKSECTMSRTRRVIAMIWITSLILCAPVLYGQQLNRYDWPVYTAYHCQKGWPRRIYSRIYAIYVAIFLFFIPVIVMVAAYGRASFELWASEEASSHYVKKTTPNSSGRGDTRDLQRTHLSTISPFSGKFSRKNSKLEKQQVMKMLLMVVFLYTMCWTPILLLNMLIEFSAVNKHTEQVWALETTFELLLRQPHLLRLHVTSLPGRLPEGLPVVLLWAPPGGEAATAGPPPPEVPAQRGHQQHRLRDVPLLLTKARTAEHAAAHDATRRAKRPPGDERTEAREEHQDSRADHNCHGALAVFAMSEGYTLHA
ncbi:hypothetical protein Bbelb_129190 [Branchiostoma belcheri]|nr:hypothetical protein Bbelb_129190 [Branchiostoma belcheri]